MRLPRRNIRQARTPFPLEERESYEPEDPGRPHHEIAESPSYRSSSEPKLRAVSNPTTDAATTGGLAVRPYSFGQSSHLTTEKADLYKEASAQIAADLGQQLAESLPGFTVEPGPLIEVEPGQDIVEDIDAFDVASVRSGHAACAAALTELGLALSLVTGMLGGAAMPPGPARKLTLIERRVLDLLGQTFVDAAKQTLLIDEDLQVDRSRDGAFNAADDDESGARIGFSFGVQGPSGGGRLILSYNLTTIQEFSDIIDARLSGRRSSEQVVSNPETATALQPVPIPFSVGLGRIELSARQLVELQVGDVIRTSHPVDSDLVASAGDVDLFGVRLGQHGNTLTAHITTASSPSGALAQARTGAT